MSNIKEIKKLRDETGISIGKCKKALIESKGDIDKAKENLKEKGSFEAQKKAGRKLGYGVIQSYIHSDFTKGSMVEILCETDFVAKNSDFITLAKDIAMHIVAFSPTYINSESIPKDEIEKIKEEERKNIDTTKSVEEQEKILKDQIKLRLKDLVLLKQDFIRDSSISVEDFINNEIQKFGERIEISRINLFN